MGDTFGGTWHRPKDTDRGHSLGDIRHRAALDNEPQTGCGALFLLLVLAAAALLGVVLG